MTSLHVYILHCCDSDSGVGRRVFGGHKIALFSIQIAVGEISGLGCVLPSPETKLVEKSLGVIQENKAGN